MAPDEGLTNQMPRGRAALPRISRAGIMRVGILLKDPLAIMTMQRTLHASLRLCALAALLVALTGCGSKKPARARVPAPPAPTVSAESRVPSEPRARDRVRVDDDYASVNADLQAYGHLKPIYVETGVASWYGPPYHNRNAANGKPFDMHAITAAHKTLPMNTVIRVTNLSNGKSALMRITDRGPFVGDRVLDLSLGAAKELGVYRTGLANVRIEVLDAPKPLDRGGRWCVQIGAFTDPDEAARLKGKLMRKYSTAKVIQFTGPTGDWVRLRPLNDDRARAFEVARNTQVNEGGVFLVRLD